MSPPSRFCRSAAPPDLKSRTYPSPLVLTLPEAAQMLQVSESTITRAIRAGALPSFRLGRSAGHLKLPWMGAKTDDRYMLYPVPMADPNMLRSRLLPERYPQYMVQRVD
jgi:excisionase family DNA binding protein